jgi:cation diffusion facilitator family transporter
MPDIDTALRFSKFAIVVNIALAAAKIAAGVLGNSYVLIADGVESAADVFSSLVVWSGLRFSVRPADANHPFGHGKAESLASIIVSLVLLGAALLLALQSFREIGAPQPRTPESFTLLVLLAVIVIKETLYRFAWKTGDSLRSTALKGDAWHHRSDALTSAAAFLGIAIALLGGPRFASADAWAALVACGVIAWNGLRLLRTALDEVMDAAVAPEITAAVRKIAGDVEGVQAIDKCRIRKSGIHLALDIHVVVDGEWSVRRGHVLAHLVKDRLLASPHRINDVTVHIEPHEPDRR